jgi:hypothetical protein
MVKIFDGWFLTETFSTYDANNVNPASYSTMVCTFLPDARYERSARTVEPCRENRSADQEAQD